MGPSRGAGLGFRGELRFGTWIARIVINEALGCVRRQRSMVDIGLVSNSAVPSAQVIPFLNYSDNATRAIKRTGRRAIRLGGDFASRFQSA